MKKYKVFIICISFVLVAVSSLLVGIRITENKYMDTKDKVVKNNNSFHNLAMMLETETNSEKYEMTTRNEWPTSEYKFNSKLSKCENGGSLSWDYKSNNVVMEGTSSDKCYIYFDKVVTVSDYCTSGDNLADCIKTYGNVGYDKSNIYIHDGSLKYGANDNSYRFAGSSDYVNNYVCFGSNEDVCPSDNLYRIIGVFEDQVKLIKADYANSNLLGTDGNYYGIFPYTSTYYRGDLANVSNISAYYWNNSTNTNTWSESNLNTINLNANYLNNLGESWVNMIADTTWQVGGNTWENIATSAMYEAYQNEIVNPVSTTYNAKIGLMYVTDYGYGASSKCWQNTLYEFNDTKINSTNWMYMGLAEWTITKISDRNASVLAIRRDGYVSGNNIDDFIALRPTFYLKSSINYVEGLGTKDSPIKVGVVLSEYVKGQYTTQGENGLYLHNGTIKSDDTVIDASDGSYRYAGSNPNNFVCFGSDAEVCPTDNLYRIIGVFGDNVKLIKYDYATIELLGEDGEFDDMYSAGGTTKGSNLVTSIGGYLWNSSGINSWNESNLNEINLNTNYIKYLNNQDIKWVNMIKDSTWQVGGNAEDKLRYVSLNETYQNEILSPVESIIVTAKIGLMYVSDYGYAASPSAWTSQLKDYSSVINENWMYMGLTEWTITRNTNESYYVCDIFNPGVVGGGRKIDTYHAAVRPTFYLSSSVMYIGGIGSISSPIRLSE